MAVTIQERVTLALDASYARSAGGMLRQIASNSRSSGSAMQRSLTALDDEATILTDAGESMAADNPELQQTLDANATQLAVSQALIEANDRAIQDSGSKVAIPAVTSKVFVGLAAAILNRGGNPISTTSTPIYQQVLNSRGIGWKVPSTLDFAGNFIDTAEWQDKLDGWGEGYADLVEESILKGVQSGWGPKKIASQMRQFAEDIPVSASENLTRTLQLTSYRESSQAMEIINGDFIIKKIRIAKLDSRTCLACIDLHGTELEPGERVDDHYRGRCDAIYVVPGGPEEPEMMQADSKPGERKFVKYQTGKEWFADLPPERQAQQASFLTSPAKLNAYRAGTPLSAFVGNHTDAVFGKQVIENSLIKAIGDDAQQFYTFQPDPTGGTTGGAAVSSEESDSLANNFTYRDSKRSGHYDQAISDMGEVFANNENWDGIGVSGFSGQGEAKYNPDTNKIKINNRAEHPELSFVHEAGHAADYNVLPNALGIEGRTATLGSSFGSTPMDEFWDAVDDSDAIKKLKRFKEDDPDSISYLLDVREVHARAFSQYVAEKSGSEILLNQLNAVREDAWYAEQWTTEDFSPIMSALDKLYGGAGLLR